MADLPIVARVIDKTKPGLKSAGDNIGNLEKKTSRFGNAAKIAAVGVAGIAAAGVALGVKLVGNFLKSADAIGKMATATGIGVEKIQELDFALQQGGSSISAFEKGIQTLARGLNDAFTKGTGPVAEALEQLGLTIEGIAGLAPDEQFRTLAQAISEVEDASTQAAIAQKLFGGAGRELLPTLKEGARGLDKLTEEARRNGNIMSTDTVRGAEEVNDAINSMKQALLGAATQGFVKLLPHIKTFVTWFKDKVLPVIERKIIPAFKDFGRLLKQTIAPIITGTIIPALKRIAAIFGDDGDGLKRTIDALQKVFKVALPAIAAIVELSIKTILVAIELVLKTLKGIIDFLEAVFRGDWRAAWRAIEDILKAFIEAIVRLFGAAFRSVLQLFRAFGVDLKRTMKNIANGVLSIIEAIPNAFVKAINAIISAWNRFSLRLPGFRKTIRLPGGGTFTIGFDGITINTPNIPTISPVRIPRLQDGGIVTRPTLAEIGEAGPEAVIPLDRLGQIGGGQTLNLRVAVQLEGETLGEFVVNRINLANLSGELDLVGT